MPEYTNFKETKEFFDVACNTGTALKNGEPVPVLVISGAAGSGKSVFANMLSLDENAIVTHPDMFEGRFRTFERMESKRLLIIDETHENIDALLKSLTHVQRFVVEVMGQDSYTIRNSLVGIIVLVNTERPVQVNSHRVINTDIDTAYRAYAASHRD